MRSPFRPMGPLPASVYWKRRVTVLVVAGLVVWLVVAIVVPDPEPANGSVFLDTSPSPRSLGRVDAGLSDVPACTGEQLRVQPRSPSGVPVGYPLPIHVDVTNTGHEPCRFARRTTQVRVVVSTADDQVWDTRECPSALSGEPMTVRPGRSIEFVVVWHGRRSAPGCPQDTESGAPGSYLVEATVIDAVSEPARIRLR